MPCTVCGRSVSGHQQSHETANLAPCKQATKAIPNWNESVHSVASAKGGPARSLCGRAFFKLY